MWPAMNTRKQLFALPPSCGHAHGGARSEDRNIGFGRNQKFNLLEVNDRSGRQPTMLKSAWMKLTVKPLLPEIPERNAHLARLVSQIVLDAGARKDDQAHRQCFEHPVIAFVFGVSTYGPEKGLRIMEGLGLVAVT